MILKEIYTEFLKDGHISALDSNSPYTITFDNKKFDNKIRWSKLLPTNPINIDDIKKIVFNHCTFHNEVCITYNKIYLIEFNYCTFANEVDYSTTLLKINDEANKRIIFNNCKFEYFIIGDIKDVQHKANTKLCRFNLYGGEIDNLIIQNIELANKVYFNRQQENEYSFQTRIENLKINNSIFKENFKAHYCNIHNILIQNTDFKKQADFYKSSFHNGINDNIDKSIRFKAINFGGLTIFGHCEFTKKVIFSEVTFEDFVHFKEAHFENGLDLDYANIQKEMNFFSVTGLDSRESMNHTSQETYRIIKYYFHKIGNQIESNKYHALELNVHRQNTWYKIKEETWYKIQNLFYNDTRFFFFDVKKIGTLLLEIIPSLVHKGSSNYGQSWLLPLIWIFLVGMITNCLIDRVSISNIFNFSEILNHISIINLDGKLKDNPAIFLFNKISLGYLYYQFIIATRKNTKK